MTAYLTPKLTVISSDDGENILSSQLLQSSFAATTVSTYTHQAVAGGSAIPVAGITTLLYFVLKNDGTSNITVDCTINSVDLKFTVPAGGMIMLPNVSCAVSSPIITGTSKCLVMITG